MPINKFQESDCQFNTHSLFRSGKAVVSNRSMGHGFIPFARRWQRVQRQSPAQYFQHCSHVGRPERSDTLIRNMLRFKVNKATNCWLVCCVSCFPALASKMSAEKHFSTNCSYKRTIVQEDNTL
jgi:hypothetical protein